MVDENKVARVRWSKFQEAWTALEIGIADAAEFGNTSAHDSAEERNYDRLECALRNVRASLTEGLLAPGKTKKGE